MNKQPFYHSADDVLFTMTEEISEEDFKKAMEIGFKIMKLPYVEGSVEIGAWGGGEAGDPADLMGVSNELQTK